MSLRITTWNVNGIRNPFSHQPWSSKKTLQAMFDILEADIVCIQELKIQKRNLKDDMVLVPGWDCFCTFPTQKKGYSGVAIYTRKSKCSPIKAEEGITGILTPPGRDGTTYLSLPPSETIGGYPDLSHDEAIILDSEGRCLVLDFGAFVLIGLYCPASIDSSREGFRIAFTTVLDERIRNLVEVEKRRVVVVGDVNISRDEIDNAAAKEIMMKQNLEDFKDTPARQILHKLLEPHENGIMVDLCREFFPERDGMYTCWDTRSNARPGNYGQRIDYILCSSDMRAWFSEANIQEGLMGSDHCPVYGVINEKVTIEENEKHIIDIVNPPGLFIDGKRQSYQTAPQLKLSAQASGEFSGRQSIRDMFLKGKTSPTPSPQGVKKSSGTPLTPGNGPGSPYLLPDAYKTTVFDSTSMQGDPGILSSVDTTIEISSSQQSDSSATSSRSSQLREPPVKRQRTITANSPAKRFPNIARKKPQLHGQQSLIGFFKKPSPTADGTVSKPFRPLSSQQGLQDPLLSVSSNKPSQQDLEDPFLSVSSINKPSQQELQDPLLSASSINKPSQQDLQDPVLSVSNINDPSQKGLQDPVLSVSSINKHSQQGLEDPVLSASSINDSSQQDLNSSDGSSKEELPEDGNKIVQSQGEESFPSVDPIESKEKWSRLFTKPAAPRCDVHDEPCIKRTTKKPGQNLGRVFWSCSRPLGPSRDKDISSQEGEWRCSFFKWGSDRNSPTDS